MNWGWVFIVGLFCGLIMAFMGNHIVDQGQELKECRGQLNNEVVFNDIWEEEAK